MSGWGSLLVILACRKNPSRRELHQIPQSFRDEWFKRTLQDGKVHEFLVSREPFAPCCEWARSCGELTQEFDRHADSHAEQQQSHGSERQVDHHSRLARLRLRFLFLVENEFFVGLRRR